MARLMRENYWLPFRRIESIKAADPPARVRLFGENYVVFRAEDGRLLFADEGCPRCARLVITALPHFLSSDPQ